jgi:hypothetical protein
MVELISLQEFSLEEKKCLLNELGYTTDGEYIFKNNEKIKDKYLDEPVLFSNMLILPGSTIILDNNELSLSLYLEEYGMIN